MEQPELNNLLSQCKTGDTEAFRRLVIKHQKYLFSLTFRLLCNEDDAKDAVQETFIRIWKHLPNYNSNMRFSTWAYKIATNICFDKLKAAKRKSKYVTPEPDRLILSNIASDESIEATIINNELGQMIRFYTQELTPKQKIVFTLSDLEGLEVSEITAITGLSAQKIKSNLYCARKYIREKLESL
jgi:RNA polymerase sigma-70 factor, ECF subfamily